MDKLNRDEEFKLIADNIRYQERQAIRNKIEQKREPIFRKMLESETITDYESGYLDALCEILMFITERNIEY